MNRGFSIVELLITISIMSVLGAIVLTTYSSIRKTSETIVASNVFADTLKSASLKARTMEFDSSWGVKIIATDIVLFSGNTYTTRVQSRDVLYDIPDSLTVTGPTEVVFSKLYGIPSVANTITFTNAASWTAVRIGPNGTVDY